MTTQVAIIMGSYNDWKTGIADDAIEILEQFNVEWDAQILSAHRTPQETVTYIKTSPAEVFICCAGMAAHLAGVVSAHTIRPVFGVPLKGGMLDGLDALLSTVQMPSGTPVATFGIGKSGLINAVLCACSVLAIKDDNLKKDLWLYKRKMIKEVLSHKIK